MELITYLVAGLAGAIALAVVFLSILARLNGADIDDDGPQTIIIPPVEEPPVGDMVDVRGILRRYE